MGKRKKPAGIDTRAGILTALGRRGGRLSPANRLAFYLKTVEDALERVTHNPERVRLTNQEAYTLSAAWRKFQYDGAFVPRFDFTRAEAKAVDAWYDRQQRKSKREIPAEFRPLLREWRGISIDKQGKRALVFKPSTAGNPFRKFRDSDSLERFLALPHYKEARDRIAGSIAIMTLSKRGKPRRTIREVAI